MYMPYGTRTGVSRNQKAKLAADYQELLKELSTPEIKSVGNYVLEGTLGEGTYGKVKLATHKLTSQKVAIKIIPKIHAENCTREIHHHRYLHHPNIISLLEVIPTETKIYMVLEYCEGGELFDFLVNRGGRLKENLARKMFGQLCRAMKYCHDRRVVHRDLKLENILLDANNNVKLGDFGFTRECESKKLLETICGSIGYSAPEMLSGKKYSGLEVDIWSLGVILYTLLCGSLPFDDDDDDEMKAKIIRGEYEMEEFLSHEAQDLIRSILQLEPAERPTLKQILQHPWFTIKDEEEDDDDDWDTTDDLADSESPSSAEENNATTSSHLEHLERQRREIFLATNRTAQSHQAMTSGRRHRNVENGMTTVAPSAFESRLRGMTSTSTNTIPPNVWGSSTSTNTVPPNVWGPSTSKSSRRSSIDSKAFNEKIFFTSPEEKELLEKLDNLGFDIQAIKHSVLEGKVDSSSGLWWLQLTKLREKKRIEGAQSSITMVDVAVGTSDDEVELVDDIDEELDDADSPEESNSLPRSSHEEESAKVKNNIEIPEEMMPPTPPPKTYHSAPASRERRKSLILSLPEAVEPVLTTITATASPPLSPKKYSSFTSPLSSRSVSPIPTTVPITIPIPMSNGKVSHRKKGGIFSTLKGWWVGANHHKDSSSYKKNILNWAEGGVVVPTDVARTRSRHNRRSGSKTPPNHDGGNVQRSSSASHGSIKERKKKNRNSLQGSKNRRYNFPPLIIPPVTPSIVLSQNSPTSMMPIPGTPPAARSKTMFTINRRNPFAYPGASWGRKQVKRRSTGGSSINQLVENFNSTNESGSSENNSNKNNQCKKDTLEKSAIKDIRTDAKNKNDTVNIDVQSIIVESSKFKTIALASPPPTPPPPPPPPKKSTETSAPVQEKIDSSKADKSSFKISEERLALSDDGEESDVFVDAASEITSHAQSRTPSRTPSPSPPTSTSVSPLPNSAPDNSISVENPSTSSPQPSSSSSSLSITAPIPRRPSQSSTTLVSPPLSPTDANNEATPLPPNGSNDQRPKSPPTRALLSGIKGKNPETSASPVERPQLQSALNCMSTPPESPKMSQPSFPSIHPVPSKSSHLRQLQHNRTYSSPSVLRNVGKGISDSLDDTENIGINMPNHARRREVTGSGSRRDSSPSPPSVSVLNGAQRLFLQNNATNSRRSLQNNFPRKTTMSNVVGRDSNNSNTNNFNTSTDSNSFSAINSRRPKITNPPKPQMIMEEEEEE